MELQHILEQLPYRDPFLYVDRLHQVNAEYVEGSYTFKGSEFFYSGHFKDRPVTPGVILTECCAQIGLVCLGIYLMEGPEAPGGALQIAISSSEMQFMLPVYPGDTVRVVAHKIYFRFHKLKCRVKMYNSENKLVCTGELSGMLKRDIYGN